jgi:phosphate:Na+ symporter
MEILMKVVGGLGLFLLGMKYMSEGMQTVAGEGLRKMISAVTSNRFMACLMGIVTTCLVQSSSITTVMVVGLVNSSFMTLNQAIGVIMGANIGTTITGWILVLNIGKYGLPMLGSAALVYLFSRRDRLRYAAMAVMGIGMIFFGLELMSNGFKPLRTMPAFVEWFHRFQADSYFGVLKCALIGCIMTMIVQSSSATLVITIGLAEAGMIPYPTAAALVIGENVGTTITALLASIGGSTNARRAAWSHSIFNLTGVVWVTAIFGFYMVFVRWMLGGMDFDLVAVVNGEQTFPHIRAGIAATHTFFNVINTAIFMPLFPLLAKLVTVLVPEAKETETPHLTYLNVRMLDAPVMAIQQSKSEIGRMADAVEAMSGWLRDGLFGEPDPVRDKKLFHREEILDVVQKEVVEFLSHLISSSIPQSVTIESRRQLRMADEYESISDYMAGILKLKLKIAKAGMQFSEAGKRELQQLHDAVDLFLQHVNTAVRDDSANNPQVQQDLHAEGKGITRLVKSSRASHLRRVESGEVTAHQSLSYTDILSGYRKIKDHGLNIIETYAD